ncbi:VOC family protein [Algoriphagus sp. D3-2-R+10]|uniref:VOC family protein n=1 Tax=Algoriphagus aurantiacus TaxID=3103948 RepID=UPI002B38A538|nr:VOC family protein [Algoriphagus sp. D3-2-R+10]MEB2773965.1 VOC family protein [Algoriphagus sp. D3-2-R+10]
MKGLKVPNNYQAVMPYLILKNAESFINFAVQVFDATVTFKEMRDSESIMHAEISIGSSTVMVADSNTDYEPQNAGLFVYVKDADAAFQLSLELGSEMILEVSDKPYGRIRDPFGNTWWITSVL